MKIQIDLAARTLTLVERENFTDLRAEVAATASEAAAVDRMLREEGAGASDGAHAFLSVEWLQRAAEVSRRGTRQAFDGMVAYADKQGWVDHERGTVRAHLVWQPPTP